MVNFHPLSYNQELMLAFGAEAGFDVSRWNHQVVLDLVEYDDADIREALRRLCLRHEVLRTRIGLRTGRHCQVVEEPGGALPHRVEDSGDTRPEVTAGRELSTPFDLYESPLFRSVALPRADGGAWLILTLNHLVSDRQSEIMLAAELAGHYERAASRSDLEPAPDQYADFARWQRAQVAHYLRDPASASHWLDYEKMVGALWASDHRGHGTRPRYVSSAPPDPSRSEAVMEFTAADMVTLVAYCRARKVTLNTVFLAAFVTAISTVPDLGVGLILGEKTVRYPYRFAETLGPFPDLWPISSAADSAPDFPGVLSAVHDQILRAMDVALPFHVLVGRTPWLAKELRNERRAHWVFYQYFNEAASSAAGYTRVAGIDFPDVFGEQSGIFGLHLQMRLHNGLLRGRLNYRADSFHQSDIGTVVDGIRDVLRCATGQPVRLSAEDPAEQTTTGTLSRANSTPGDHPLGPDQWLLAGR